MQLKEQFSLAELTAILEELFASYLKCVMLQGHTLNTKWQKKCHGDVAEATLRRTLNTALLMQGAKSL